MRALENRLRDYLKYSFSQFLTNTSWDSVKDQIYFQDEVDQDFYSTQKNAYILISLNNEGKLNLDSHLYTITISFVMNDIYKTREVNDLQGILSDKFEKSKEYANRFSIYTLEPELISSSKVDDGVNTKTIKESIYRLNIKFK